MLGLKFIVFKSSSLLFVYNLQEHDKQVFFTERSSTTPFVELLMDVIIILRGRK